MPSHAPRNALLASMSLACAAACGLSGCNAVNAYTMNESGRQFYRRGNLAMAHAEFQRAVIDDPHNPDYVHNLAAARERLGDLPGAESLYRHALQVDPGHQPSYHRLADLMIRRNRHAEAVDLLEQWVATQPYSPAAHIEMAWLQRRSGDAAGAESSLQHALQLEPRHPVALAQLGDLYQATGRAERAIALYERSLQIDWAQQQVRNRLTALRFAARPTWFSRLANRGWASPPSSMPAAAPSRSFFQPQTVTTHRQTVATAAPLTVAIGTAAWPGPAVASIAYPAHLASGNLPLP